MIYGYARVSTTGQASRGNSLEDQVNKLKAAGADEIVSESHTGTTTKRPKFSELLEKLGSGDTLVVTKLDRFARTAREGTAVIQELIAKDVTVNVLNMGILNNSPVNKALVTMMLAFAEFERDMIVERVQEGKRIAKLKPDFKEGRPRKFNDDRIETALELLKDNSFKKVASMTGISVSTLVRAKKKQSNDLKN